MFWILRRVFGFWEVFWIPGCVSGFWDVFWILESVLDSGMCFWILGCVLDSGMYFLILRSVLDSGMCFVPMSHGWIDRKHEKRNFVFPSGHTMFYLLFRIKVEKTTAKMMKNVKKAEVYIFRLANTSPHDVHLLPPVPQ